MDFFDFVRDVRIWFSFLGYNWRARAACQGEADRIFSTSELESDLRSRRTELESESRRMWGDEIERLESEVQGIAGELRRLEDDLDLFRRDYRSELDAAYRRLNEIKYEQRLCNDELRQAHESLNEARRGIQSWHNKSTRTPWLFGNAGRPLPKHSLFGQSFGDLDELKSDRACAVYSITNASDRKADLNRSFQESWVSIREIKSDRQRMFDLRKSSRNASFLARRIAEVREFAEKSGRRAAQLRAMREAWETRERKTRGIDALEAKIREIEQSRQEYIASFDSDEELAKRRAQNRADWLREQGVSVPAKRLPRE